MRLSIIIPSLACLANEFFFKKKARDVSTFHACFEVARGSFPQLIWVGGLKKIK